MQFSVPQFIEVEDKIFGPLTFKQFIYVIGGAGLSYIIWTSVPVFIRLPLVAPVLGLTFALAFYKYNDRPFIFFIESVFNYLIRSKLYLWKHKESEIKNEETKTSQQQMIIQNVTTSKLRDLSWSLDINEFVDSAGNKIEKMQ